MTPSRLASDAPIPVGHIQPGIGRVQALMLALRRRASFGVCAQRESTVGGIHDQRRAPVRAHLSKIDPGRVEAPTLPGGGGLSHRSSLQY